MAKLGTPVLLAGVFALGVAITPWSLSAEEKDPFDAIPGSFSADVAITNDYVYRGTSQTDEHPALQGGIYWENSAKMGGQDLTLSAGVWGSNVDFNDGDRASVELDWIAGIGTEVGGVGVDLGYIFYSYPGSGSELNYNFHEFSLYVSKDFDVASVSAGFNWSPHFFGGIDDAYYYDLGVDVPLPFKLTASAHLGINQFKRDGVDDYIDWSVGISRPIKGIDVSATYYDTDIEDGGFCGGSNTNCTSRFVAAISKSF